MMLQDAACYVRWEKCVEPNNICILNFVGPPFLILVSVTRSYSHFHPWDYSHFHPWDIRVSPLCVGNHTQHAFIPLSHCTPCSFCLEQDNNSFVTLATMEFLLLCLEPHMT